MTDIAPIHHLKWGENIPESVMNAMREGQPAMLHDQEGNPYSILLIDFFGAIRERFLRDVASAVKDND